MLRDLAIVVQLYNILTAQIYNLHVKSASLLSHAHYKK
jgi:hypothetical protein